MMEAMNVHFICRGNVLRSLIAETYLKSLNIKDVEVISSGTNVNWNDPQERKYFAHTLAVLDRHGIKSFAKSIPEQLTQARIDANHDIVVLMNQRVVDEASRIVELPKNTLSWAIIDIGEGHRTDAKGRESYEEEIYQEITRKVDSLFSDQSIIDKVVDMDSRQSNLKRMDNVGIVVESLDEVVSFFEELGLQLEGKGIVEGEWAGRVTGLGDQSVEVAMMVTPDGHSRLELSRFLTPPVVADHRNAPVNALGYLRSMFTVEDIDDTVARLQKHGAELVGEIVQYEDVYRLCYIRGPEQILIGLAEELKAGTTDK
ncbi:MAG: Glyoxalase/bleomycin resistance protein/dioxygenase [Candidatus Saccharibacteria bacterium]|nr:Glyoxalase/bleomycin resistance protein/dioxygenase [Candidatus Saccharibacteria bacterium]